MSYRFGKTSARLLESLGVAGLLKENAEVLYHSLFSPKHIGRVSDLIGAKLEVSGADQLRLRSLLLFGMFEAYEAQRTTRKTPLQPMHEPVILECGADDEKIAIGFTFHLRGEVASQFEGLKERIESGQPQSGFEVLLEYLRKHSDKLIIRSKAEDKLVELVTLLAVPGKLEGIEEPESRAVVVLQLAPEAVQEAPEAQAYVELGDTEYTKLLAEDVPAPVPANAPPVDELPARFSQPPVEPEEEIKIESAPIEEDSFEQKIQGVTENQKDETIKVAGGGPPAEDQTEQVIKGTTEKRNDGEDTVVKNVTENRKDEEIEVKGEKFEARDETSTRLEGVTENRIDEVRKIAGDGKPQKQGSLTVKGGGSGASPAKSVFRLGGGGGASAAGSDSGNDIRISMGTGLDPALQKEYEDRIAELERKVKSYETADGEGGDSDVSGLLQRMSVNRVPAEDLDTKELEDSLTVESSKSSEKNLQELKEAMREERQKKLLDGMMTELLTEKAKLVEKTKKLLQTTKAKEIEFRNRENSYIDELKKCEDLLKQKSAAVMKYKDDLARATMNMEHIKSGKSAVGHGAASGDAALQKKIAHQEKLLQVAKEENLAIARKVEELKNQLGAAKAQTASQSNFEEMTNLKKDAERSKKQIEEFKKINKQLMDKLAEAEKKKSAKDAKGEDATKTRFQEVINAKTKEIEQVRTKLSEVEKENLRLKGEVNKLTNQMKGGKAAA